MSESEKPEKVVDKSKRGTRREASKYVCPITRAAFAKEAGPLKISIDVGGEEEIVIVKSREFSTGSFGWFSNDKVTLTIAGVEVKVQLNVSLVVVGSKEQID